MDKIEAFKTLEIKLQNVSVSAYDAIIELVISLGLYGDALIRPDRRCAKLYRSRWEGCEYCAQQNVELCPMLSHDESDCDRGMYIHDGCLISNSGEFQYAKIKFCPMCGRPLTEAAWAELERRINGGTTD